MTHRGFTGIAREQRRMGKLAAQMFRVAGVIGLIGLAAGIAIAGSRPGGAARFHEAYLVNYCYLLSLSLGALFFVLLHHVTRSGWSVVVRRLAEIVAANLLLLIPLFIPVIVGMPRLYAWTHDVSGAIDVAHGGATLPTTASAAHGGATLPTAASAAHGGATLPTAASAAHGGATLQVGTTAQDQVLAGKQPYLNAAFFLVRFAVYFIVWGWTARYFLKRSTEQDASGDVNLTLRMERWSGPAMVLYAFTVTFASFDLVMSLDAHWYSTIFGVYFFAGCAVGFFSLLALAAMGLQSAGRLSESITVEHYHDLGKWIFAFVFFWGYIAFSQYMLIWYANVPEETSWLFARQTGAWAWPALILLFGHFGLPFTVLLSRETKRRRALLGFFAAWMLVMHWIDIWWMITPRLSPGVVRFDWLHVTCLIGLGGVFVAGMAWQATSRSLMPERDPRLPESLAFENL